LLFSLIRRLPGFTPLTAPLSAPSLCASPPGPGGLDWRPLVFLLILLLLRFVVLGSLEAALRGAYVL
ncbi:MAG: hypothetical protein LBV70_04105, partial [Candidatus Adiutrix sp.]|nr:hypothetical protein [Candidatus Adiutrix sp.]